MRDVFAYIASLAVAATAAAPPTSRAPMPPRSALYGTGDMLVGRLHVGEMTLGGADPIGQSLAQQILLRTNIAVTVAAWPADDVPVPPYPLLLLTARGETRPSQRQTVHLLAYVEDGGALLVVPRDDASVRAMRAWAREAFPARPLTELPLHEALPSPEAFPASLRTDEVEDALVHAIGGMDAVRLPRLGLVLPRYPVRTLEWEDAEGRALVLAGAGAAVQSPHVAWDKNPPVQIAATRDGDALVLNIETTLAASGLQAWLRDVSGATVAESTANGEARGRRRVELRAQPSHATLNPRAYWVEYAVTGLPHDDGALRQTLNLGEVVGWLDTEVLGQSTWRVGSPAAARVICRDGRDGHPVPDAEIEASLLAGRKTVATLQRRTDGAGTAELRFPQIAPASDDLRLVVHVRSRVGDDRIEETVRLDEARRILLTTDKPTYQPGQLMHLRALTLRAGDLRPVGEDTLTFEVEDAKGNKVFKVAAERNRFGVAAAEFLLADEVNLGSYKVRALDGATTQERTVAVEKYVLPRFRVATTVERPDYRPGETMRGSVQVDYFFGKPVAQGNVEIVASQFDAGFDAFARLTGKTNDAGAYEFELELPTFFAGLPLERGDSFVQLDVTVTDRAEHKETATVTRPVVATPISIVVIPESGELVRGVENEVYVVTSAPSGEPLRAHVEVTAQGETSSLETDAQGIATFRVRPDQEEVEVAVAARDAEGRTAARTVTLGATGDDILLRPARAILRTGETLAATVLSTQSGGWAYVDVIRGGQTVLTKSVPLEGRRGEVQLPLDANDFGTLALHAYQIGRDGDIRRDTRLVYVSPADDLTIDVRPGRDVYRPGDEATVSFHVADGAGHPVLAAIGVHVVDESVFARQENQPGLAKVFFTLEKELLRPKYEVHGFDPEIIAAPFPMPRPLPEQNASERKEQAARVLFAAAELAAPAYTLALRTGDAKNEVLRQRLLSAVEPAAKAIVAAIEKYERDGGEIPASGDLLDVLVARGRLAERDTRDPWGGRFLYERRAGWDWRLRSAGPDGRFGTFDDVTPYSGGSIVGRGLDGIVFLVEPLRARGVGAADRVEMGIVRSAMAEAAPEPAAAADVAPTRVREFFPETLLAVPSLLTDEQGNASLTFPLADSITQWRLSAMASSLRGQLGSTTAGIRVFQDFFLDVDLPVALTAGDEVSVPVALHNYLDEPQTVRLQLERDDRFDLLSQPETVRTLDPGQVTVHYFRIRARKPGAVALTVRGYGSKMADAVRRRVEVVPNGRQVVQAFNDRLTGNVERVVEIPRNAIAEASKLLVKIHPGVFSQVLEGLDAILQMPFGCFEQTSSTTYPNILALAYMKETRQGNPEVHMKAHQYINLGYQRLLAFEVAGGGFEWFGNAPANQVLTAYGLMEFVDMARVYEVDPQVVARTAEWLLSRQNGDGSWSPDAAYLHAESWGRVQANELLPTAYVLWALAESGNKDPRVEEGIRYLTANWEKARDAYMLALVANALVSHDRTSTATGEVMERLRAMAVQDHDTAHWASSLQTMTYAGGDSATLETTGLAALALLKWGGDAPLSTKALTYLVRAKDANGTWNTTQATILALKALLIGAGSGASANGAVVVRLDGRQVDTLRITPEDSDVMRLVDLGAVEPGAHKVGLDFAGEGMPLYQIVGRHYEPWGRDPVVGEEPLAISVAYDRTRLAKDETIRATCTLTNRRSTAAKMVLLDLAIPPGFAATPADFTALVEAKTIQKYEMTSRQVILYFEEVRPGKAVQFSYDLRAKYPIRATAPASKAYLYYNPEQVAVAAPVEVEVVE
jgi:hypothetical protein